MACLVLKFEFFLDKYGLSKKKFIYVKDESFNFNAMTNAFVNLLVWKRICKEIVLVMFFAKHVTMTQQMKKCVEISNMFLLCLHK
jgi:hypothetical protein